MTEIQENTEKVVQYLFGELDAEERDALEDRLFSDEELSLFLSDVEKDLIDGYVRDEMDSDVRRRFEKHYLNSERRREKVRLAALLQNKVFAKKAASRVMAGSPPSFWESLAEMFRLPQLLWAGGLAVILLLALFGGWIFWRQTETPIDYVRDDNSNRQNQIPTPHFSPAGSPPEKSNLNSAENSNQPVNGQQPEHRETNKPEKKPASNEKRETVPAEPQIFVATLLPLLRSDQTPVLLVPKNTKTVLLRVVHDNQKTFAQYRAEIRNQNGEVIFSREIPVKEKNLARPITLKVNSSALNSGSYEVTLSGITNEKQTEAIKFYNFVVRQK